MENPTIKNIIINRLIIELTRDMQENLYNQLNATIDDDIEFKDITEAVRFKLNKDYLIPADVIKGWLITKDINLF
jgi:hypothetical protein